MRQAQFHTKSVLFLLLSGFVLPGAVSGYLYYENKTYQHRNHRLIIVNDSILSENIELKKALQQRRTSTAIRIESENFKLRENE